MLDWADLSIPLWNCLIYVCSSKRKTWRVQGLNWTQECWFFLFHQNLAKVNHSVELWINVFPPVSGKLATQIVRHCFSFLRTDKLSLRLSWPFATFLGFISAKKWMDEWTAGGFWRLFPTPLTKKQIDNCQEMVMTRIFHFCLIFFYTINLDICN